MSQLQLMIGGRWAPSVGPWGSLEWSTCMQGSDTAAWSMDRTFRRIQARQSVRIYDGPTPIWFGLVTEQAAGESRYSAEGAWREAYNYRAIDTGGTPTPIPDDAIDGAISRGMPWTRSMSFNTGVLTAVSADLQGEIPSVGALLDAWCHARSAYWMVGGDGAAVWYTKPSTPSVVLTPDQTMNAADDEYVTKLFGIRKSSGGVKTFVGPVTDSDAATRWGAREDVVDLTEYGNMTDPYALAVLQGVLDKQGARLGWTSALNLGPERVATAGGVPYHTPALRGGMLARAMVQWDDTRDLNGRTYRDFMISRTAHSGTDLTVGIEPVGLVPRDLASVTRRLARRSQARAVRVTHM